jgi:heme-degrading monooxygenase HmoA
MIKTFRSLLLLCSLVVSVQAFVPASPLAQRLSSPLYATVETDEDVQSEVTAKGLLKRDRYVATNRFTVRKGKAAKFEKRWANRKSRLATLDGFKYFHLMRRVNLEEDGKTTYAEDSSDETFGNYVSFTIWEKKSHFSAWRKGSAFIEAHGGTSIGAFVSTMVNSAMILKGAPRPAFYDGLMLQAVPPANLPELVDGWRSVEADGENTLPVECFVACNNFFVPPENAAAFEKRWADRESKLNECDGFVCFSMLRRDGQAKGHGTVPMSDTEATYQSTTIWRDRQAFDGWREGKAFGQAHGQDQKKEGAPPKGPPGPLWSKPPQPVFYEGTLVITTSDGS